MNLATRLLLLVTLGAGCTGEPDPTPHPCEPVWGAAPAGTRIHVDGAAAAGGDGTLAAPVTTLWSPGTDSALELAIAQGASSVAIASGDYEASFVLDASLAGLEVTGCGAANTTLLGVIETLPNGQPGDLLPVINVSGQGADDILIRDLTLSGGRRNLVVQAGAGAGGAVVAQDVLVDDALRVGVLIDGVTTVAHLVGVDVTAVAQEGGAFGWGIAVQTRLAAGSMAADPAVLDDVTVDGASGVGVLVDAGFVDVLGLDVTGTQAVGGTLGRGVHLQGFSYGTLDTVSASGNSDAALFLSAPGRDGIAIDVVGGTFSGTAAADIPGTGESSGDGIVVTDAGGGFGAGAYLATFSENVVSAQPRAGVLVEAVTIQVGPNNVFGKGTILPFGSQDGAVVEGLGGGPPGVAPEVLDGVGGSGAVEILRTLFALDDPTL